MQIRIIKIFFYILVYQGVHDAILTSFPGPLDKKTAPHNHKTIQVLQLGYAVFITAIILHQMHL